MYACAFCHSGSMNGGYDESLSLSHSLANCSCVCVSVGLCVCNVFVVALQKYTYSSLVPHTCQCSSRMCVEEG